MRQMYHADTEYAERLIELIDRATQRVYLQAMSFDHLGVMRRILDSIYRALDRGIEVRIVYDRYTHFSLLRGRGAGTYRAFQREITRLQNSGAHIHVVGKWKLNPFAGRNHVKCVVIDDVTFIGGGVNLGEESFVAKDFMFEYADPKLADTLYGALPLHASSSSKSTVLYEGEDYAVLHDGGQPGDSLIYEQTCSLAAKAKRVWYVSKLAPDSTLLASLKNRDVHYWFNTFQSASDFDKVALVIDQVKYQTRNSYSGKKLLHAKFCVFENADGQYIAVSGSHNFNSRGVRFGTQELAVMSHDQDVCRSLIDFAEALPTK